MKVEKPNRIAVYEYLMKEGVMVAKKNHWAPRHECLPKVPNTQVIKTCKSLASRGYVREQFAWRSYYWYLTNEGIQYLRDVLHLPPEIVPPTLKRTLKDPSAGGRPQRTTFEGETEPDQKESRDRPDEGYRRGGFDAPRTGFGRGRPAVPAAE